MSDADRRERDREREPFEAPAGGWEQLQEWAPTAPPAPRHGGPLSHPQLVAAIRDAMALIGAGEAPAARDCLENLLLALGARGGVRPPLYGRVGAAIPPRRRR